MYDPRILYPKRDFHDPNLSRTPVTKMYKNVDIGNVVPYM